MGQAAGDEELSPVLGRKFHGNVPAIGRRAFPQIDGHIEHPAFKHTHELGLRVFSLLEMQAAHGAEAGLGLVVLDEVVMQASGLELRLAVAFEKIAARVFENAGFDDVNAVYVSINEVHGLPRRLS